MASAARMGRFLVGANAFIGSLYGVLLPLSLLALLVGNMVLLWVGLIREIDPVQSQRVVSIDPANRYLDRDHFREFTVIREICADRDQQVEVVRAWSEGRYSDQARPIVVFTSYFQDLRKGCHLVKSQQVIPETLPPAQYVYSVHYRSCNALNRCVNRFLDEVPFAVLGGAMWHNLDVSIPDPMALPPPMPKSPGPARGGFAR